MSFFECPGGGHPAMSESEAQLSSPVAFPCGGFTNDMEYHPLPTPSTITRNPTTSVYTAEGKNSHEPMFRERRPSNIYGSFSSGWIIKNHREQVCRQSSQSASTTGVTDVAESKHIIIKKPVNCFIVFSKEKRAMIAKLNPHLSNVHLSKLLSKAWKEMAPEEQKKYRDEAKRILAEYNELKVQNPNISSTTCRIRNKGSKKRNNEDALGTVAKVSKIVQDNAEISPINDVKSFSPSRHVMPMQYPVVYEAPLNYNPQFAGLPLESYNHYFGCFPRNSLDFGNFNRQAPIENPYVPVPMQNPSFY